jgi:diguanylate cyclase (GGDEF)-like protein
MRTTLLTRQSSSSPPASFASADDTHPQKRYALKTLLRDLTTPLNKGCEAEQRRARMLAWTHLTLIVLISSALLLTIVANSANIVRRMEYALLIGAVMAILLTAFVANHRGRYPLAAALTVACVVLGPWGAIVLDGTILRGDFVPLVYIGLSVFVSALLLTTRVTLLLAVAQCAALALVPVINPSLTAIDWPSLISFVVFLSVLSVISNLLHHTDLEQIERQTRQLQESEAQLRQLSIRDSLTGLFNRRYMEETLTRELRRAREKRLPLSIIMIDLDFFKRFNDTYGHPAGDAMLSTMGKLLRTQIQGAEFVCRYGGEEFLVVLPETTSELAQIRAEALRQQAPATHVLYDGRIFEGVTLSLGVAVYPEDGITSAELLQAADSAMYRAKHAGRNRVALAGP